MENILELVGLVWARSVAFLGYDEFDEIEYTRHHEQYRKQYKM